MKKPVTSFMGQRRPKAPFSNVVVYVIKCRRHYDVRDTGWTKPGETKHFVRKALIANSEPEVLLDKSIYSYGFRSTR